jgi:alpha-tubulin suppressor-like RCC1 family protein
MLPVAAIGLNANVSAVAAGGGQSLAIQNGALYAWGGGQGVNPDDTTFNNPTPTAVTQLASGVTAISAGQAHSLAVQNGAVYAWGFNGDGEVGDTSTSFRTTPVPVVGLDSGVTQIAAGEYHNLALRNGALYTWGSNGDGELGDGSTTNNAYVPIPVSALASGVTAIAGGWNFSMAIKNGGVYVWGTNSNGELGDGTTDFDPHTTPTLVPSLSSGVTAIAGGDYFILAVKNGQVYSWGYNGDGELGDGSQQPHYTPAVISGLSDIVQVAAGESAGYALSADGRLWAWGLNDFGELGQGDTNELLSPTEILAPAGYEFSSIDADGLGDHAVATLVAVPEPAGAGLFAVATMLLASGRRSRRPRL